MSIPVPYADIGKPAHDLLVKDFPTGKVALEVKTVTNNGVTFTVNGNKDSKTGIIHGELKTKYVYPKNGLTLTEAWTTSNHLTSQIELESTVPKGLKLDLHGSLLPAVGQKNAKIGLIYKQPSLHTKAYLDLFKTHIVVDTVVSKEGFIAGGEVAYDILDGKLTRHAVSVGFTAPEYSVALHASSSFNIFSASYHHRVNKSVEAAGKAVWDSKASNAAVALEVGSKYHLDRDAFIKAKINNSGILGLGYTQTLQPGVKVSLAGCIDTTRLNENAHKVGLSLTLEA